jgi:hypothetical protein
MKVKIFSNENEKKELLLKKVNFSLEELWLLDFINVESTNDEKLKEELNIQKEPALIIEEESIDFKDVIFEWIIPEEDELKSMFISIIWWNDWNSWCNSGACWSWCSC